VAATTLLATAVRGTTVTPTFSVPAGVPGYVRIALVSPVYATTPGLTWDLLIEQSFDNGASWSTLCTSSNASGSLPLPAQMVRYDGTARLVRATVTVPTPFNWGITGDVTTIP
jgi:hypothetical protein